MSEFQRFVEYLFGALENMALWDSFQQLSYSNEILMFGGGLLVFFSVMRIVKSSFKMIFWVLLSALGLASISHGMSNSPKGIANENTQGLSEYLESGKIISNDVLELLCAKLDEVQNGGSEVNLTSE